VSQFGKPLSSATPASGRSSLLTYEPYYGLREKPFSISADPRFLYKSPTHAPTFEDLRAGIRRREGLIVLTGDIGTGKTTLCRAVLESLDRKTFSTFVPDPFLSREDLLKMLLVEFGVVSIDDLKSGRLAGASRPDLSYPLYDFLKSLVPLQAFAVLVIDEAQNLSLSLLEEIRILSDLEDPEKLLQVVLVGQSELQDKLRLHEMRQVDQRVSVRCDLQPLNRDDVGAYIAHRLDIAGGGRGRVAFTEEAADEIYRVSKGVPRVVNLICDRALHHGFLERTPRIYPPHVVRATVDLGLRKAEVPAPPSTPAKPAPAQEPPPIVSDPAINEVPVSIELPDPNELLAFPVETPELVDAGDANAGGWRDQLSGPTAMAVVAFVLAGLLVGLFYWQSQSTGLAQAVDLPRLPTAPRADADRVADSLPMHIAASIAIAERPALHAIDVATFTTDARAADLVAQLTSAGYRAVAEARQFSSGQMIVVRVGPFILQSDADVALSQIRQLPGYADARVVTLLPDAAR
jgi:general secretion pathway protein A